MKRLTAICCAALLAASSTSAAPLCDEFLSLDTMPKKYRKLAPVLSGSVTDWIITNDQMDKDYVPSAEAADLLAQIVHEFEKRGTKLAILIPPPRPLIAGQKALDGLTNNAGDFNVETVSASFNQMIDVVNGAGAIAPNLLEVATRDPELTGVFYYRHDTHWTPRGAAESAVALAEAVIAAGLPAFEGSEVVQPILHTDDIFSERGSLADMVKSVCGVQIPSVDLAVPSFPPKGAIGLLDDAPASPRILLAGSSFSNRYKKDAYRVADAISGALQADVVNHSVSGGGAIGSIEGIVSAGLLGDDTPVDLLVWELPYTDGLRNIGVLRQLLGALQFEQSKTAALDVDFDTSGETKIKLDAKTPEVLALHLPNTTLQRLNVDLRYSDGAKTTLGLTRKSHVPATLRSDWWVMSLEGLADKGLLSVAIRYDAAAVGALARARLY